MLIKVVYQRQTKKDWIDFLTYVVKILLFEDQEYFLSGCKPKRFFSLLLPFLHPLVVNYSQIKPLSVYTNYRVVLEMYKFKVVTKECPLSFVFRNDCFVIVTSMSVR